MTQRAIGLLLLPIATATATAEPIATGAIQVIDGDTINARGQTVRLVGFDTPKASRSLAGERCREHLFRTGSGTPFRMNNRGEGKQVEMTAAQPRDAK